MIETDKTIKSWLLPHEIMVERVEAFRFTERKECLQAIFDRFTGMRAAEAAL